MASTRVSAWLVPSCSRKSLKGSMVESVAGDKCVSDLARDNDGFGVALGRKVVFRLGVSVG